MCTGMADFFDSGDDHLCWWPYPSFLVPYPEYVDQICGSYHI